MAVFLYFSYFDYVRLCTTLFYINCTADHADMRDTETLNVI